MPRPPAHVVQVVNIRFQESNNTQKHVFCLTSLGSGYEDMFRHEEPLPSVIWMKDEFGYIVSDLGEERTLIQAQDAVNFVRRVASIGAQIETQDVNF